MRTSGCRSRSRPANSPRVHIRADPNRAAEKLLAGRPMSTMGEPETGNSGCTNPCRGSLRLFPAVETFRPDCLLSTSSCLLVAVVRSECLTRSAQALHVCEATSNLCCLSAVSCLLLPTFCLLSPVFCLRSPVCSARWQEAQGQSALSQLSRRSSRKPCRTHLDGRARRLLVGQFPLLPAPR